MAVTVSERSDPVRIESVANRHTWNDLITGLPDCALEQGFEWGEILKESGYEPYRLAVFDGALHVAPLLYWHFIRWARASGCASIHWGGIRTRLVPTPGDPDYDVYQFKSSFGSECVTYGSYYDCVFRSGMYRLLRTAERRYGDLVWRILAQMNH